MKLSAKTRAILRYLWLLFLAGSGGLVTDRLLVALRDYWHVSVGQSGMVVVYLGLTVAVWWVTAVEWRRSCDGVRKRSRGLTFGVMVGAFLIVSGVTFGCFPLPSRPFTTHEQHYWGVVTAIDAGNTAAAEAIIGRGGDNNYVPTDVCRDG